MVVGAGQACRVAAQRIAQAVHVDRAGRPAGQEIGPIETRAVQVAKKAGGGKLDAAAQLAPCADQRGQTGDGAHGHPAAVVALETVVDANRRGPDGGVFLGQLADPRRWDAGEGRCAFRRPFLNARRQLVEADGVLGHVLGVVQPIADDRVHHGQGQRTVRAWADGNPLVRGLGGAGLGRVDDDDPGPVLASLLDEGPQVQVAGEGVAAPDQDQPGMGEGFGGRPLRGAHGVEIAFEAGLGADGAGQLAGAQPVEETGGHPLALEQPHGARVGIGQDRFRPIFGGDLMEAARDGVDSLFPRDRRKLTAALGANPLQRRRQPLRVIGALQVAVHLPAEPPLGDGMFRVAPDVHGAPALAFHGDLPTARVGAVVGADAGDDFDGGVSLVLVEFGQ